MKTKTNSEYKKPTFSQQASERNVWKKNKKHDA